MYIPLVLWHLMSLGAFGGFWWRTISTENKNEYKESVKTYV